MWGMDSQDHGLFKIEDCVQYLSEHDIIHWMCISNGGTEGESRSDTGHAHFLKNQEIHGWSLSTPV